MNYRHSFHAGNFADLLKHAVLLAMIDRLGARGPLTVIDTHAGAGLYDLSGDAARSREAEAGVLKLMQADALPPPLARLRDEVRALNPAGPTRWYPGSPLLAARALGQGRYIGFELNPPVAEALTEALEAHPRAQAMPGDGFEQAPTAARAPGLVLIDPPFERPDDYRRAVACAAEIRRLRPGAPVAIWAPLKDLETFDAFVRDLEGHGAPSLIIEARLRPLTNPMKMNGCVMAVTDAPPELAPAGQAVADWIAAELGEAGARAEVWTV